VRGKQILKPRNGTAILGHFDASAVDVAAHMDANSIPDDIKTFIKNSCRSHDATARRGSGSCPLHKGPTDVPSVMTCSEWLVVIGSLLQIVGVAVVFVELAVIRSNEFGEPTRGRSSRRGGNACAGAPKSFNRRSRRAWHDRPRNRCHDSRCS